MLRLTTFGGVGLSRDGAALPGVADGWRRKALLALVATAPAAGVSRDAMAAYLWPDSAAEQGRHSLDQLLHTLRRGLGINPFKAGQALRLDAAVISSELAVFTNGVASRWSRCSAATARASSHGNATPRRARTARPT